MTNVSAQASSGPAYGEGRDAYTKGKTIEQCLAASYYANHARMMSGGYHVATGYAEAAKANGADAQTCAGYITAGHTYQRKGA
jgi:hypothetical protein